MKRSVMTWLTKTTIWSEPVWSNHPRGEKANEEALRGTTHQDVTAARSHDPGECVVLPSLLLQQIQVCAHQLGGILLTQEHG